MGRRNGKEEQKGGTGRRDRKEERGGGARMRTEEGLDRETGQRDRIEDRR